MAAFGQTIENTQEHHAQGLENLLVGFAKRAKESKGSLEYPPETIIRLAEVIEEYVRISSMNRRALRDQVESTIPNKWEL